MQLSAPRSSDGRRALSLQRSLLALSLQRSLLALSLGDPRALLAKSQVWPPLCSDEPAASCGPRALRPLSR